MVLLLSDIAYWIGSRYQQSEISDQKSESLTIAARLRWFGK